MRALDSTSVFPLRRLAIVLFLLLTSIVANAQRVVEVSNYSNPYQYHVPADLSFNAAKQIAIQNAQVELLRREFGTRVVQSTSSVQSSGTSGDYDRFSVMGFSDVMGVWIKTLGEPELDRQFDIHGNEIIEVKIKGKAREIRHAQTQVISKVLDNPESSRESLDFKNDDYIYLSFRTPVNGFVAVYLLVLEEDRAYCLLPYSSSTTGKVAVKANTDYLFFSENHPKPLSDPRDVDQYILVCDGEFERDMLYIFFSPNPFVKANDTKEQDLPRMLSIQEFREWMGRNMSSDDDMQYDVKNISISR